MSTLLVASVAPSTAAAYSSGWKRWIEFAEQLGVGHLPSEHAHCACVLSAFQGLHLTAFALMFCAHQFFVKALRATTICGYLSGVAHNLCVEARPENR
jgi:hypothetical protein